MKDSADQAERYAAVIKAFSNAPDVSVPADGAPSHKFGANALKINNKIFAMLVQNRFVVKLPAQRVNEIVASGEGEPLETGQGRVQKEWVSLNPTSSLEWLPLAQEARTYVDKKR